MDRRTRRASLRATLCAAAFVMATAPAAAPAQVTTDLNNWHLSESASTWPSQFSIGSSGDGWAAYRWLDSPSKTTVIAAHACGDGTFYGSASIPNGNTNYYNLFWGSVGACFVLRGRTAIGSGSMLNHDGRIRR